MTGREAAVRAHIMRAFAATGAPPDDLDAERDGPALRALAERHVVVLDPADPVRIRMAHPFAAHTDGARVDAAGRTWWGNCAWDGLGIVAALDLDEATIVSNRIALRVARGAVSPDDVRFHVAVPARSWWADIGFT